MPVLVKQLPKDLTPIRDQGGVIVGLDPKRRTYWSGWLKYRDDETEIEELRVSGPMFPIFCRPSNEHRLTEPIPTESKPTETKPTEPKPTEPIPTEPIPTEPIPTEPIPTEPIPTEPIPTEPIPTEPKPTETKPTEQKPTNRSPRVTDTANQDQVGSQLGPAVDSLRFSRQIGAIGVAAQNRINRFVVTLVGCGGLGSAMAVQLSMIGIRRIRIIDPDCMGIENLERTFGSSATQTGQAKVRAVAQFLRAIRPDLTIVALVDSAQSSSGQRFLNERSDLVITCADGDMARLTTARIAARTATIHMDVASSIQRSSSGHLELFGDIRLCLPGQGCLNCVGGIPDRKLVDDLVRARPSGSLPPRFPAAWHQTRAGSLVSLNSIVAGAALQSLFDLITGRTRHSIWIRLEWTAQAGIVSHTSEATKDSQCDVCNVI